VIVPATTEPQTTPVSPTLTCVSNYEIIRLIHEAIGQGAPLFNCGRKRECIQIYQDYCQKILEYLAPVSEQPNIFGLIYKEFIVLNLRLISMMDEQALSIQLVFDSILRELTNPIPIQMKRKPQLYSIMGPKEKLDYFRVENDGLTVIYQGRGQTKDDVVLMRSNFAVDLEKQDFYFEIDILQQGASMSLGIGILRTDCYLQGMPGWYRGSIGYHGDDGNIFLGDTGRIEPTNTQFKQGDTVGCGYTIYRRVLFFTKNGRTIWEIPFRDQGEYFLVAGLHSMNSVIRFNFGDSHFKYSLGM